MKKFGLLFYIITVCSSFAHYNGYPNEKTLPVSGSFLPQEDKYATISYNCSGNGNESCFMARVPPKKPGCYGGNCRPDYIYKKGDFYILVYKAEGRGEKPSVILEATKASPQFDNLLRTSKDNKIFVSVDLAMSKGKNLQLRAVQK